MPIIRTAEINSRFGARPAARAVSNTSRSQRSPYGGGLRQNRGGFVLTSDLWIADDNALALHAGPSEVSWSLPLRASTEDIKSGRAHYTQARSVGAGSATTYFDLPTAQFTFQSGNILPIPPEGDESNAQLPYGLLDFYYFLELVNQPPLIPSGPNEGAHNYLWVFYSSLQFPNLVLRGYIEPDGVTWPDSAESPNSFTWSATMAVYDSTPELWSVPDLADAYDSFEFVLF